MTEQIETIDMTPTDRGFLMLARRLMVSVLSDVKPSRREAVIKQLIAVLDVAVYLGRKTKNRGEVDALVGRIMEGK